MVGRATRGKDGSGGEGLMYAGKDFFLMEINL
jgi:hypothetical protein